ncbi:MAG: hypothetical protein D6794_08210 [Deltaproteobacteria bacterium]|nr:MAG: hypothetical protein D6794_08210 [Deltaproteobacteria bacterium]
MKAAIWCSLFLSVLSFAGHAQTVMEIVDIRRANFTTLFSEERAQVQMDLIRQYDLDGSDTSMFIRVGVGAGGRQNLGETWGRVLFDLQPAWQNTTQYLVLQRRGEVVLTRPAFEEVFACANNVYSYVVEADRRNDPRFFVVSCEAAGITLGGEYNADNIEGERTSFYWRIGDNGTRFHLSEKGFGEVIRAFRELSLNWQEPGSLSATGQ